MIKDSFAIFRARKDPALAARLARDLVVDGALERASLPLTIAKFWMGVGITVGTIVAGLISWGASASHWVVAIPALPFIGIVVGLIFLWRGLDKGKARVVSYAKAQIETGYDAAEARLMRAPRPDTPPT